MILGRVVSIVRYSVKSMAGEALQRATLTAAGLADDRLYAFESTGAPAGMLRLTGRERREMLRYRPRMIAGEVVVKTPSGEDFAVESPELLAYMHGHIPDVSRLTLTKKKTPQTDVRPLSLMSLQTVAALSDEMGIALDAQRFRMNFMADLAAVGAFGEDELSGRRVRIGGTVLQVLERVPRCRFVTYEPEAADTAEPLFGLMKLLDRRHEGRVGVYASVMTVGEISVGDAIELVA